MHYTTAAEAVKLIRSNDSVYIQGSTSIPEVLVRAMTDRLHPDAEPQTHDLHLAELSGLDLIGEKDGRHIRSPASRSE